MKSKNRDQKNENQKINTRHILFVIIIILKGRSEQTAIIISTKSTQKILRLFTVALQLVVEREKPFYTQRNPLFFMNLKQYRMKKRSFRRAVVFPSFPFFPTEVPTKTKRLCNSPNCVAFWKRVKVSQRRFLSFSHGGLYRRKKAKLPHKQQKWFWNPWWRFLHSSKKAAPPFFPTLSCVCWMSLREE